MISGRYLSPFAGALVDQRLAHLRGALGAFDPPVDPIDQQIAGVFDRRLVACAAAAIRVLSRSAIRSTARAGP